LLKRGSRKRKDSRPIFVRRRLGLLRRARAQGDGEKQQRRCDRDDQILHATQQERLSPLNETEADLMVARCVRFAQHSSAVTHLANARASKFAWAFWPLRCSPPRTRRSTTIRVLVTCWF